ncbi:hypothetical protein F5146DRAFT_1221559, partial [Armillaria mellea]
SHIALKSRDSWLHEGASLRPRYVSSSSSGTYRCAVSSIEIPRSRSVVTGQCQVSQFKVEVNFVNVFWCVCPFLLTPP